MEAIERIAKAICNHHGRDYDAMVELNKDWWRGAARAALEAMPKARECEPMVPDEGGWSEWIHPLPGYLMQCCDCGLIHEMEFAIGETRDKGGPLNDGESDETGAILFRARRHAAQVGRHPDGEEA